MKLRACLAIALFLGIPAARAHAERPDEIPMSAALGPEGRVLSDSADHDGDGIPDSIDDCVSRFNPDQTDTDGNGAGDACDPPRSPDDHAPGTSGSGSGTSEGSASAEQPPPWGGCDVTGEGTPRGLAAAGLLLVALWVAARPRAAAPRG